MENITVAGLIKFLSHLDPNARVVVNMDDSDNVSSLELTNFEFCRIVDGENTNEPGEEIYTDNETGDALEDGNYLVLKVV